MNWFEIEFQTYEIVSFVKFSLRSKWYFVNFYFNKSKPFSRESRKNLIKIVASSQKDKLRIALKVRKIRIICRARIVHIKSTHWISPNIYIHTLFILYIYIYSFILTCLLMRCFPLCILFIYIFLRVCIFILCTHILYGLGPLFKPFHRPPLLLF